MHAGAALVAFFAEVWGARGGWGLGGGAPVGLGAACRARSCLIKTLAPLLHRLGHQKCLIPLLRARFWVNPRE
ncbi:hypothetical protein N007_11075 [Alicyclobacillus acidoterrestris ATCC 49025]|nr:hypothetical protein N007_11075 [Alicyclobacillus acidoterrestris ATCC 49025]